MTGPTPPEASALVVEIPLADPVVGAWRARYDPVANHGMPAHVTLLYPFRAPARIDSDTLATAMEVIGRRPSFTATFGNVATFPANVVYLAPDPSEPFVALTEDLARAFPDCPPYGGAFDEPVPHLTIGHTGSPAAAMALRTAVAAGLHEVDLTSNVVEASLYTRGATGGWIRRAYIPLGPATR